MTTKEQTELLMDAVQKLMKLYKALSEEIPRSRSRGILN